MHNDSSMLLAPALFFFFLEPNLRPGVEPQPGQRKYKTPSSSPIIPTRTQCAQAMISMVSSASKCVPCRAALKDLVNWKSSTTFSPISRLTTFLTTRTSTAAAFKGAFHPLSRRLVLRLLRRPGLREFICAKRRIPKGLGSPHLVRYKRLD